MTELVIRQRSPAFLQFDHDGRLLAWGGPLAEYGLTGLARDTTTGDIPMLAGMLPSAEPELLVPCVSSGTGWPADIHVVRGEESDWVLLLDAREAHTRQQLLQQKANELALTHEREARLIEELDAFAHTVAHDLRGPLTTIVGFADLLRISQAYSDRTTAGYIDQLFRGGKRMGRIIEELLLLAGVRQTDPPVLPVDMAQIVEEARERLAYMIEQSGAEFVVPEAWPAALGHAPWVEEIWANYISNAVKYGGKPPRVELGASEQPDGMVRFWVRDNGGGISAEDRARLFTPHTRLDGTRAKGHGLGLSIVRRIARKLGGQVGVESTPGEGSVFFFLLRAPDGNP